MQVKFCDGLVVLSSDGEQKFSPKTAVVLPTHAKTSAFPGRDVTHLARRKFTNNDCHRRPHAE